MTFGSTVIAVLIGCSGHAECINELLKQVQGSGYVAALASGTLGAMVQSDSVRSVLLRGEGTKPVIRMLGQTNAALPGNDFIFIIFIFIMYLVICCP